MKVLYGFLLILVGVSISLGSSYDMGEQVILQVI